jgi:hypothetical protein
VAAVPDFCRRVLAPVDVDKCVVIHAVDVPRALTMCIRRFVTRTLASKVAPVLPFDVRKHPHAQSAVAESMMARLEADMARLAHKRCGPVRVGVRAVDTCAQ